MNEIDQRTDVDQTGTAFSATRSIAWGYDSKGQVVKADSTENAHDRAFQYDGIGNRLASETGSTTISNPAGTDTTEYTPNALNQYASITGSRSTGVPPVYDNDGNALTWDLTTDPLTPTANLEASNFIWDAENRLVAIEDSAGNTIAEYTYDSQSRRIRREVTGQADIAYIYDNWNPIAEYNFLTSQFSLLTSYTWGPDLSGTMQGAGGVGGLLATTDESGTTSQTYYPTYDGNGNVSEYLDSTGAIIAHYEYDAFGNVVHHTEALAGQASTFRHRFSTKLQDGESGFLYYGFRYYDPVTGRWPSRDPIEEQGGINLYGFVGNDGVNAWDWLGLKPKKIKVDRCSAHLYIAHDDKDPVEWDLNGACAIGGFVGCNPAKNQPKDSEPPGSRRPSVASSPQWPNLPDHPDNLYGGSGTSRKIGDKMSDVDEKSRGLPPGDPRAEHNMDNAVRNAVGTNALSKIMDELCKCCSEIKIIIEIDKDKLTGNVIKDAVAPWGWKPGETKEFTLNCP